MSISHNGFNKNVFIFSTFLLILLISFFGVNNSPLSHARGVGVNEQLIVTKNVTFPPSDNRTIENPIVIFPSWRPFVPYGDVVFETNEGDYNSIIQTLDMSQPKTPRTVDTYDINSIIPAVEIDGLAIDGHYLYASFSDYQSSLSNGMMTFEILANASLKYLGYTFSEVPLITAELFAADNLVYQTLQPFTIDDYYIEKDFRFSDVIIYDCNDPHHPQKIGNYTLNTTFSGFTFSSDYLYLSTYDLPTDDENVSEIQIIDVSIPSVPKKIASIPIAGTIEKMVIQDNYLFSKKDSGVFLIYDISEPSSPLKTSEILPVMENNIEDFQIVNESLFVIDRDFLYIYDISQVNSPVLLSKTTPSEPYSLLRFIFVEENLVYLLRDHIYKDRQLAILDISNLSNPEPLFPGIHPHTLFIRQSVISFSAVLVLSLVVIFTVIYCKRAYLQRKYSSEEELQEKVLDADNPPDQQFSADSLETNMLTYKKSQKRFYRNLGISSLSLPIFIIIADILFLFLCPVNIESFLVFTIPVSLGFGFALIGLLFAFVSYRNTHSKIAFVGIIVNILLSLIILFIFIRETWFAGPYY
ncbi:MAG: hypothetical protein U9O98_07590 [Asgard group archaeon]|nr:hypothetical protein [Asgard group archaeon]